MIEVRSLRLRPHYRRLHGGSDREVYILPGKQYVLKVAMNSERALIQNYNECIISEKDSECLVAKVVARSKGYKYIVMELANRLRCGTCSYGSIFSKYREKFDLYEVETGLNSNGKEVAIDYGFTTYTPWFPSWRTRFCRKCDMLVHIPGESIKEVCSCGA